MSDQEIANELRRAVSELNAVLAKAANANLHVVVTTIHAQNIDERYGRDMYHATIEKRTPILPKDSQS